MPKGPPVRSARRNALRRFASSVMQACIADRLTNMADLCAMMDEANPPKKRWPYKI
jgi:hypothetical protein